MKTLIPWLAFVLGTGGLPASDGLRLMPEKAPQQVFGGGERSIHARFTNPGDDPVESTVCLRLLQASTTTTVVISESPWKTLRMLPGQTVFESATIAIPEVRAEVSFALQWLDPAGRVMGVTHLLAYPTNLLQELSAMAGAEHALGVFDPANVVKPLLGNLGMEFENLEESGVAAFRGRLAVLGPFASRMHVPDDFAQRVEAMAGKGVAAVWLLPPPDPRAKLQPSFETVAVESGTVVLAQAGLVADLALNPQSQLNLLHLCRRALNPQSARLPESTTQPKE